jgi:hypothetical protein
MSNNLSAQELRHFTTQQAAEYLNCTADVLNHWRVSGHGPPFYKLKDGKKGFVRYAKRDLDAWLASRRRLSTSDPGPQPKRRGRPAKAAS